MVDTKTLGTWLKQKQQENKDESIKDDSLAVDKSSDSSSIINEHQMDFSSSNINGIQRKIQRNRPYSATLRGQTILPERSSVIKEILNRKNPWQSEEHIYKQDLTEPLTKSALIYRLMRSRLEANLAKSISASRQRSIIKKKYSSSTSS